MNSRQTTARAVVLAVILSALPACGTSGRIEHISPYASFDAAVAVAGKIVDRNWVKDPEGRHVVIIMDRHATTSSFMRLRPQLREIQRANRLMMEYLVQNGYSLLGCEKELGELVENEKTTKQFSSARARLEPVDDLDHFSVYQPIRFKLMFTGKLAVWGVEDPDLYRSDVEHLKTMLEASRRAKRYDLESDERTEAETTMRTATAELSANIVRRGVRAAQNLCDLMAQFSTKKAVLLLGGAHCAAAAEIFKSRNIPYVVFRSDSYDATDTEGLPSEADNGAWSP